MHFLDRLDRKNMLPAQLCPGDCQAEDYGNFANVDASYNMGLLKCGSRGPLCPSYPRFGTGRPRARRQNVFKLWAVKQSLLLLVALRFARQDIQSVRVQGAQ